MIGIPLKENVDVGDIYLKDNHIATLQIASKRITDKQDTIYFAFSGYRGNQKFYKKNISGPFSNGQIIDSVKIRKPRVYDSVIFPYLNTSYGYDYRVNQKDTSYLWNNMVECEHDTILLVID